MQKQNAIISMLLIAVMVLVACSNKNQISEDSTVDSLAGIESDAADSTGEQSSLAAQANREEGSKEESSKGNSSVVKDKENSAKEDSTKTGNEKEDSRQIGNESSNAADKKDESSRTGNESSKTDKKDENSQAGNDVTNTKTENSGSGSKQENGTGGNSNNSTGSTQNSHKHSYRSVVTAPTCTAEGYTTYTCSCGDSYTGDSKKALGHSWGSWKTVTAATTSAGGLERRTCSRCGKSEERATNPLPPQPYYLTQADIDIIYARVRAIGESYGLKYYPEASGYVGDTWDAPVSVYSDELIGGREYLINIFIECSPVLFQEIVKNSVTEEEWKETFGDDGPPYHQPGFGLYLKCPGTYAYYELYINWA